jgi:glycosyltransferase involved in cell wall biosynthesis
VRKLKILHLVESYHPSTGGMQEVVRQISERLVHLGHEVNVYSRYHVLRTFSILNGVQIKSFNIIDNPKVAETKEEQRFVSDVVSGSFDIIVIFAAQQWSCDLLLPVLHKLRAKKVFVPTGFSGLFKNEYHDYFEAMRNYIHHFDASVFLSDNYRDINFYRENKVDKTKLHLIPNGAAEEEFEAAKDLEFRKRWNISADEKLILHVGSYTGVKGHKEAIEIFLKSKVKKATLLMIGNNYSHFLKRGRFRFPLLLLRWLFSKFTNKKIKFAFVSRHETVQAFLNSDIFLFPSNIECSPIVLFESMAAGLPFLTSDVGNSKEIIEWSKGGILIPTQFDSREYSYVNTDNGAALLDELIGNEELRNQLAFQGKTAWKNNFTWNAIAHKYEQLYLNLTNDGHC